ncbi:type II toxin-antitoxin system mRNA interferase toxin, RelE/StbE family [Deferribacterales bacterium Es71-Z0220]|uniref:type II toxin-antitoxin system RelE/ParE family toxin n=1 Tax=Deferrivibrio essentukiensis TaxID=2880922 RepID=UPI001F615D4B|nr:type II toxin-antitoxin system mRNA interferase toxin, RelE/StbE family [Deferrivibrio essentukiensis]MCB4204649.1 type II toxin-antitoxin system mRNA interferase toxin, RelE/StbE family [Deferrivibrio essentukiensis]
MYEIIFTESYEKCAVKFFKKHPELVDRYKKILYLLKSNPYHPSLRLHKLKGNLKDFYSVSINLEYRIILHFIIQDKTIIPIDIGKHDDVY